MGILFETDFDAGALMREHPPRIEDPRKRALLALSYPLDSSPRGSIRYARHEAASLSPALPAFAQTKWESRSGFFDYVPSGPGSLDWHLNFANSDLFCMYGTPVLAQDEIQVVEHPTLGCLREALLSTRQHLRTVENGNPTPITIAGVERRCRLHTEADAAANRPADLYGRRFASAAVETVVAATEVIVPPTTSNILAIEAPNDGRGAYTRAQIERILRTAFAGFVAARHETLRRAENAAVVIHTGYWGCGAYGGDRVLMTLLQLIAAWMANIDRIVFHVGDDSGIEPYQRAERLLVEQFQRRGFWSRLFGGNAPLSLSDLISQIVRIGFVWGQSDRN